MRRFSHRQIERMMRKLGMKVEPLEGVSYVEICKEDGQIIHIESPEVIKMEVSGQTIFQISGGEISVLEEEKEEKEEIEITDEDIEIVSQQAGVDKETARKALIVTKGDLVKAIMMLKESRTT